MFVTYLNSNVETRDIEGLEHDLCCVLSVFWCVEGRLCLQREREYWCKYRMPLTLFYVKGLYHCWSYQKKVVVFRFCPQILEYDLLHESLHQVPVLHYSVTDGPLGIKRITCLNQTASQQKHPFWLIWNVPSTFVAYDGLSMASSPMKKSRSSTPFIILRWAWSPTLADSLIAIPGDDYTHLNHNPGIVLYFNNRFTWYAESIRHVFVC